MPRIFAAVLVLIAYGTLYPGNFDFHGRPGAALQTLLTRWPESTRWAWRDAVLNVGLYFPLGLTCYLAFYRRWRIGAAVLPVLTAFALSSSLEFLQFFLPRRSTSPADVVCNVLGAALGAAAATLFRSRLAALGGRAQKHPAGAALLLAGCWFAYQLYPLFPDFRRSRLTAGLSALLESGRVSISETWLSASEWFSAALLIQAILGRLPAPWLAAAMISLGLRFAIQGRRVGKEEVIGAALSLAVWRLAPLVLPRFKEKERMMSACAAALLFGIAVRALSPFRLAESPSAFSWIPFGASLTSEWQSAVVILLRKTFDYGAAVWLLHGARIPYRVAGAALTLSLGALEAVQLWLPGRTPEITDPVLAVMVAVTLAALSRRTARLAPGEPAPEQQPDVGVER